jgi:hypothetical protein
MAIAFYLYFLLMNWMLGKNLPMLMFVSILSLVPVCTVWGSLGYKKMRVVSYDFLLPVSREAYLRQQGIAAAVGQFQVWVAVVASLVLCILTTAQELRPWILANAVAFSALSQIWQFGLAVWILRYRSLVLYIVGLIFMIYSTMTPSMLLEVQMPLHEWQSLLVPVGAVLAIFGLLLTWSAYHCWLVADLD